jgi:1-phosphatidylinositol-3-phosphate 5-kinase
MPSFENSAKNIKFRPEHPFIKAKLTMSADSREVQTLFSHFRACGSRLPPIENESQEKKILFQNDLIEQIILPDCLDPASHQGISVLFCSFLHNSNT